MTSQSGTPGTFKTVDEHTELTKAAYDALNDAQRALVDAYVYDANEAGGSRDKRINLAALGDMRRDGSVPMTGNLDLGTNDLVSVGQVDGRDVSADGTKLDGIEAGADVTDATNVAAAGGLIDANDLSDVSDVDTARANLVTDKVMEIPWVSGEAAADTRTRLNGLLTSATDTTWKLETGRTFTISGGSLVIDEDGTKLIGDGTSQITNGGNADERLLEIKANRVTVEGVVLKQAGFSTSVTSSYQGSCISINEAGTLRKSDITIKDCVLIDWNTNGVIARSVDSLTVTGCTMATDRGWATAGSANVFLQTQCRNSYIAGNKLHGRCDGGINVAGVGRTEGNIDSQNENYNTVIASNIISCEAFRHATKADGTKLAPIARYKRIANGTTPDIGEWSRNVAAASATQILINKQCRFPEDHSADLALLNGKEIRFVQSASSPIERYNVTGVSEETDHYDLTVTYVSGSEIAVNTECRVADDESWQFNHRHGILGSYFDSVNHEPLDITGNAIHNQASAGVALIGVNNAAAVVGNAIDRCCQISWLNAYAGILVTSTDVNVPSSTIDLTNASYDHTGNVEGPRRLSQTGAFSSYTGDTYTGTADASSTTTAIDDSSASWTVNEWANDYVRVDYAAGAELVKVVSNTATRLVLDTALGSEPDSESFTLWGAGDTLYIRGGKPGGLRPGLVEILSKVDSDAVLLRAGSRMIGDDSGLYSDTIPYSVTIGSNTISRCNDRGGISVANVLSNGAFNVTGNTILGCSRGINGTETKAHYNTHIADNVIVDPETSGVSFWNSNLPLVNISFENNTIITGKRNASGGNPVCSFGGHQTPATRRNLIFRNNTIVHEGPTKLTYGIRVGAHECEFEANTFDNFTHAVWLYWHRAGRQLQSPNVRRNTIRNCTYGYRFLGTVALTANDMMVAQDTYYDNVTTRFYNLGSGTSLNIGIDSHVIPTRSGPRLRMPVSSPPTNNTTLYLQGDEAWSHTPPQEYKFNGVTWVPTLAARLLSAPRGYWVPSLDTAGDGTTTLTDLSGLGANGTCIAARWQDQTDNGGTRVLDFTDVAGDTVDTTQTTWGNGATVLSICAWVRLDSGALSGGDDAIRNFLFRGDNAASTTVIASLGHDTGTELFRFGLGGSGYSTVKSTTVAVADRWYHVCGVYDGVNQKIYIDGIEEKSTARSVATGTSARGFQLGSGFVTGTGNFRLHSGWLDDVFIFDRAISQNEILEAARRRARKPLWAIGTAADKVALNNCTGYRETWPVSASDETTALTVGDGKATFRFTYDFVVTDVIATVATAPTGSAITIDIELGGASIFSTLLTIDATESTSTTAATPHVLSTNTMPADTEVKINIDGVGSTVAGTGLKLYFVGYGI